MELTNNLKKLVSSLQERKHRKQQHLFKAEGTKCVTDTFASFSLFGLFATASWLNAHPEIAAAAGEKVFQANSRDLDRMSSMSTPPEVIAVYHIPEYSFDVNSFGHNLAIALDGVQDPGNLGTIMRSADWFGVTDILCSHDTADVFSPKVVQATMGAISRVKLHYCDLCDVLSRMDRTVPLYGTFLEGDNIYETELSDNGVIIMGNEGKGISADVASLITKRLFIPPFSSGGPTSESLNVATATAIVLSEFRRRQF